MTEVLLPTLAICLLLLLVKMLNDVGKVTSFLQQKADIFTPSPRSFAFLLTVKYYIYLPLAVLIFGSTAWFFLKKTNKERDFERQKAVAISQFDTAKIWYAPEPLSIKQEKDANLIQYGRDLIAHTSDYLGPQGTVRPISNGMNCQNCHLDGGAKPFGNNYSAVVATYPKFRARSGATETIVKRVNDCLQRSLNGQELDSTSLEMQAILAYFRWLGQAVPKAKTPKGSGLLKLKFLNRAANLDSGRLVFIEKCQRCHGSDGQGLPMPEGNNRRYPPLWGLGSYNEGAGLYRLASFAGYVKANMPFGATYGNPQLSDAEAWDVAAFVNTQPRPKHPFLATDFPKIEGKPFDHPFGPFADTFPERQHKFGPFQPIVDFQKRAKEAK